MYKIIIIIANKYKTQRKDVRDAWAERPDRRRRRRLPGDGLSPSLSLPLSLSLVR